jgi:hypothetical protein
MSAAICSWLCTGQNVWTILLPIGLFIASEIIAWIPKDKVQAGSVTQLLVNIIKDAIAKLQSTQSTHVKPTVAKSLGTYS